MSAFEIIVLSVALATDAFALTVANCATYEKTLTRKKEWAMPTAFAAFQFGMPLFGYFLGGLISGFLQSFAKFLSAGVFFILAAKIVFDVIVEKRRSETVDSSGKPAGREKTQLFGVSVLMLQAVATSIDAFVIGITFAATSLPFSVFAVAGVIGIITFAIVAAALFIGKSLGRLLGEYAVWLGAIILFALAVKNLIEGIV
ncbi:MAG: manganese efflux pump [Clostridia bacterium]|nr:manganese efflux pump [Clostridia bacterium]